jgi:hypothetical protein
VCVCVCGRRKREERRERGEKVVTNECRHSFITSYETVPLLHAHSFSPTACEDCHRARWLICAGGGGASFLSLSLSLSLSLALLCPRLLISPLVSRLLCSLTSSPFFRMAPGRSCKRQTLP